jgi:hypothetical protein
MNCNLTSFTSLIPGPFSAAFAGLVNFGLYIICKYDVAYEMKAIACVPVFHACGKVLKLIGNGRRKSRLIFYLMKIALPLYCTT